MRWFSRVTSRNSGSSSCKAGVHKRLAETYQRACRRSPMKGNLGYIGSGYPWEQYGKPGCLLTMSNLVDRFLLWAGQLSILIQCIFFKEEPDFITRGQEIIVSDMIIVACRKLCLPTNETDERKVE